jgi:hypothetical protein
MCGRRREQADRFRTAADIEPGAAIEVGHDRTGTFGDEARGGDVPGR